MKERPILFRPELVRKILDGQKTQTRRAISPEPHVMTVGFEHYDPPLKYGKHVGEWAPIVAGYTLGEYPVEIPRRCPYGMPGDRLWVREGFTMVPDYDILDDGEGTRIPCGDRIAYRADGNVDTEYEGVTWKPSIHMPRWASRLTLEITAVRVERLQEITEEDARAEGCDGDCGIGYIPAYEEGPCVYHFAQLWEEINGVNAWGYDPWVWVVEFKPIEVKDVR